MSEGAIKVLSNIRKYHQEHGYMPTTRELCTMCKLSSTSSVNYYMEELFDTGVLVTEHPGSPRAYRINV